MATEASDQLANRGTGQTDGRDDVLDAQLAPTAALTTVRTALAIGRVTGDEIGAILNHIESTLRRFDSAPGPLTQQAIARDLLNAYQLLRERELASRRGPRGELWKEVHSIGGKTAVIPWTAALPTRLEKINVSGTTRPIFSRENIDRWIAAASYRAFPVATRGIRRVNEQRTSEPEDSTVVNAFNLIFVKRQGKTRQTLPWPLPNLVVPNAYRIDLVKTPGMSFTTRDGRIQILAYLLEVLAETSTEGYVYSSRKEESVEPAELASVIIETASVGLGRLIFEGDESQFKAFERADPGYKTDFVITDSMIEIFWHYTDIKCKYRHKDRAEAAKGCGSIEWITELLKDVPHRYKELWVQDRMMNDRAQYPDNLSVGSQVPLRYFLTEKAAESLEVKDKDSQAVFVGGFTANDRIIKTEDGRVWLIKERERNLQAFCQAVMETQGFITLSYIMCSTVGAVLGGPLAGFLMTAGDVAIDINEAGGVRAFLNGLRSDPLKAAWFMFDLLTMVGDAKGVKRLLTSPHETLEASMRAAESNARTGRSPPVRGTEAAIERSAANEAHMTAATKAEIEGAQVAKASHVGAAKTADQPAVAQLADARGARRPTDRPESGRPSADARAATRPTNSPPTKVDTPRGPSHQPDLELEVTDAAKTASAARAAEETADAVRRRPRPRRERGKTVRDVRERRRPGGGEKRRGSSSRQPGSQPIRGKARLGGGNAARANKLDQFLGSSGPVREAAQKLDRLKCGKLVEDIAEEFSDLVVDGRHLLKRVAALADDEIRGLAAVRRALIAEPVIRAFKGATSELEWLDLLHLPDAPRGELLRLIARIEPVVDSGLSKALARTLETGEYSIQGGLGHFHAAAYIADEYRSLGLRMVMEEQVFVPSRGFRQIDIRAAIGGVLRLDIEVKTYLGQLVIYNSVRGQIVKDLIQHIDDGWEGLRYLYSPNVQKQLGVVRQAILDAFDSAEVQKTLRSRNLDAAASRDILLRRLDDAGHPMVGVYAFALPK